MSNKLIGYVWDGCAASGMKLSSVVVMARLADWCNEDGVCWPSVETISRQTGAGISTVRTAIAQLEKDGWLTRKQRRKGNRNASNVYQLNVAKLFLAAEPYQKKHASPDSDQSKSGGSKQAGNIDFQHPDSDASKSDQSKFDASESHKKEGFHPPESGGDPSVNSTTDPSLNPTHNARGELVGLAIERPTPDYPGQPGTFFPASQLLGKFPMSKEWKPSADFRKQANLWGRPVPEKLTPDDLRAAHACFVDYWISEGKAFNQTQWEQKFALHLQNTKPTQPRGNSHAGLDKYPPTANAAQRRMLDARAAQLRERGQSVGVLDLNAGNLLQPLDGQKRIGSVGPMDCADWEFDQRPDDERL